eukprot:1156744-Pelagomonas_calceolata.AAC.5
MIPATNGLQGFNVLNKGSCSLGCLSKPLDGLKFSPPLHVAAAAAAFAMGKTLGGWRAEGRPGGIMRIGAYISKYTSGPPIILFVDELGSLHHLDELHAALGAQPAVV